MEFPSGLVSRVCARVHVREPIHVHVRTCVPLARALVSVQMTWQFSVCNSARGAALSWCVSGTLAEQGSASLAYAV